MRYSACVLVWGGGITLSSKNFSLAPDRIHFGTIILTERPNPQCTIPALQSKKSFVLCKTCHERTPFWMCEREARSGASTSLRPRGSGLGGRTVGPYTIWYLCYLSRHKRQNRRQLLARRDDSSRIVGFRKRFMPRLGSWQKSMPSMTESGYKLLPKSPMMECGLQHRDTAQSQT